MLSYWKIFVLLFMTHAVLMAHNYDTSRVDSHAPIGVMADHYHKKGDWMISLRTMSMKMDKNYQGTSSLSVAEARALGPVGAYMMVPVDMKMDMHMLGLMYAPNSKWTLMLMTNYLDQEMKIRMANGTEFETESSGLSDLKLTGMLALKEWSNSRLHLGLGLSLPTGSIEEKDDNPTSGGAQVQLPYPMQLGSGTYDFEPALTYNHQIESVAISWGAQLGGVIRIGENDHDYSLGDVIEASSWAAYNWNKNWSSSLRLKWKHWGDIDGSDSQLTASPNMMPTADPNLRGGQRLDLGLGLNLLGRSGRLKGHRLALEYIFALHQDLNGPQLGVDSSWMLGYQKAW